MDKIEITREDFDALNDKQQKNFVAAGATIIEPSVKDMVASAMQPIVKELETIKKQTFKTEEVKGLNGAWVKGLIAPEKLSEVEKKAVSTYANYTTSADGGATVPLSYANRAWELAVGQDGILQKLDMFNISAGNSIRIPVDETSEFDDVGVTAYWIGEGQAATATKPVFKTITLLLAKLVVFLPITEELVEDNNVNIESYLITKTAQKMNRQLKKGLLTTSAGQITSAIDSACRITVQRHTASTFSYQDVVAMYAAMWPESKETRKAVWVMTPGAYGKLLEMEDSAGHLVFAGGFGANNSVADAPSGSLLGLNVIQSLYLPAVGVTGDVMLLDFTQCAAARRGPRSDMSIHFAFDQDINVMRTVVRFAARWVLSAPYKTSNNVKVSPVVILGSHTDTGSNIVDA